MNGTRKSNLLGKITVLFVICFCSVSAQGKYGGGSGTADDPYLIYTAEQMNAIGADSNDWDKHFLLCADIDLSGFTGTSFNIIGIDYYNPFSGVFVGNGHTISNFTCTSTGTRRIGLFGYVRGENAEINDLGLIAPDVNAGTGKEVGSLVGYLREGTVSNCYVEGGSVSGAVWRIGGLVGTNGGTITNSYASAGVSANSSIGGLVGYNHGTITDCYSTASISGNSDVGGLVGQNSGTITNCYAEGSVSGTVWRIGGLVGLNSAGTISNCYSTDTVSGQNKAGGLVGEKWGGTVMDSFWNIDTSGQTSSAGGTGKTTAEMQDPNTFIDAGWDFVGEFENGPSDNWSEPSGGGYPILWWQLSPLPPLPTFSGGTGEASDPYLISTATDLNRIGHNPRMMAAHFKLINDIDLAGVDFFVIGSRGYSYNGVFNGSGHTISNFTYTSTGTNYIGLFGYVADAQIKDLGLITPNVDAGTRNNVGSLVGYNRGTISNCYVDGGTVSGGRYVAGLVGDNGGTITNSYATGSVTGDRSVAGLVGDNDEGTIANSYATGSISGNYNVGGLVGSNSGTITNCYAMGSVFGDDYVGGLVGYNEGIITNSYASAGVSANSSIGGLVGSNSGTITNCYSKGSVEGNNNVGGLVGTNGVYGGDEGTITNCYSEADVSGDEYVGGLVGDNEMGTISNCYSAGSVSGDEVFGGLVGENRGTISNCYSMGRITGDENVGGLVGHNDEQSGVVTGSFWDIETSGQDWSDGGTGLPTSQMQMQITFTDAGWDFVGETVNGIEDIWFIPQQDYPHLWWEGMQVPMKLTPRTLNCRSKGNWVKAHLTLPQGFTVADVNSNRPAVLHSFGFESAPLYVFVNKDKLVEIEAAFERELICSLAGDWPDELTVAAFLTDGNIFLGTSTVRIIHPGMKVIEELAWYWLNEDCVQPDFCDGIDMNRDSLVNLLDYALLMNIEVEFVTDE